MRKRIVKATTFGGNKSDAILAEHLTAHPEMAPWCCRTIAKTTTLLSNLKTNIKDKAFARIVYSYIKCAMTKQASSPPPHIDEKAANYTANIVHRHLMIYFRDNFQSKKAKERAERQRKEAEKIKE